MSGHSDSNLYLGVKDKNRLASHKLFQGIWWGMLFDDQMGAKGKQDIAVHAAFTGDTSEDMVLDNQNILHPT